MTQKKTPATTKAMTSAPNSAIVTGNPDAFKHSPTAKTLTARQARAIALLSPGHWITREQLDRGAGASNSPDLIQQLRRKLGHDAIETEHFDALDRDGKPCRPGRYRLTDKGHEQLAQFHATADHAGAAT